MEFGAVLKRFLIDLGVPPGCADLAQAGPWHVLPLHFVGNDPVSPALAPLAALAQHPARGVYVLVDSQTRRVLRVGIGAGAGGIAGRWVPSHRDAYAYQFNQRQLNGYLEYPAFFHYLCDRQTALYCCQIADTATASQLEGLLIGVTWPAWEVFQRVFKASGALAVEATQHRNWQQLYGLLGINWPIGPIPPPAMPAWPLH